MFQKKNIKDWLGEEADFRTRESYRYCVGTGNPVNIPVCVNEFNFHDGTISNSRRSEDGTGTVEKSWECRNFPFCRSLASKFPELFTKTLCPRLQLHDKQRRRRDKFNNFIGIKFVPRKVANALSPNFPSDEEVKLAKTCYQNLIKSLVK